MYVRLLLFALLLAGCSGGSTSSTEQANSAPTAVVNLLDIVGKSETEVEAMLGEGVDFGDFIDEAIGCTACPTRLYKDDTIEIVFINGVADRITLRNLEGVNFGPEALSALGITGKHNPTLDGTIMKQWKDVEGIKQIVMTSKESGELDYIRAFYKTE